MIRILITNDDGIHSDGLIKLEEALRDVGDVYVVAPASEMSGASHSLTLARPLRIRQLDGRHWAIDGTPTDCVTLALNKILPEAERPHICVSGINHGGNLGDDATYSGTVAGALEAAILGVPGVALSLVARDNFDFTEAAAFAVIAARKVLEEGGGERGQAHGLRNDGEGTRPPPGSDIDAGLGIDVGTGHEGGTSEIANSWTVPLSQVSKQNLREVGWDRPTGKTFGPNEKRNGAFAGNSAWDWLS
jgi:hypothetical protein